MQKSAEGCAYEGVAPLSQLSKVCCERDKTDSSKTSKSAACVQDKSLSPKTVIIGVVDPAATANLGRYV